jgi:hypothetical protein
MVVVVVMLTRFPGTGMRAIQRLGRRRRAATLRFSLNGRHRLNRPAMLAPANTTGEAIVDGENLATVGAGDSYHGIHK